MDNSAMQMLEKLESMDKEFREWKAKSGIAETNNFGGDWFGIGLAVMSVKGWIKANKKHFFLH